MPFPLYRDTSFEATPSPSDKLVPVPRRKENVLKPCVVSWVVRYFVLPVPRRKEILRKLCVVSWVVRYFVLPVPRRKEILRKLCVVAGMSKILCNVSIIL